MTDREQWWPASGAQFCRFGPTHVDALEHQLSTNAWALVAAVVLIAYPIARIVIPAVLHGIDRAQLDLSSTWVLRRRSLTRIAEFSSPAGTLLGPRRRR